ncbi:ParB/RepB/Spo0J family partition protein [Streptomyces lunaelactis]|uniref:ParB/RepB/Spo0J family partition protein n=1 Tax=Streptomyces lunaelactis TaxID=1535768 RepID=UPI0015855B75|nr:ParB/RepB/Spo0J family partition protein [Streptomyces lunaelactis]NUK09942.1 ParB/RepB/Spo0J family partition protein [Streptomyces lunaelactis]NUK72748.1 ParB/RepB/Spo0J family partition protein [Streptomyces lunaelactis]NUL11406.1 ParB/RepB/Spo0J family partition protein [Streptomyces lunaelactis]NUL25981.1 ParB/RepB/Spo0J family partition protein [Streptomyces lunaelactis]
MSSKASALGTGSSFQQAQSISPRRAAINAATKAPTEGAPPPVELPVSLISLNPANPRSKLGDLTDLTGSMRDHGQKTAISIMSRFTYIEANPDREEELEAGTKYVVIDGNSRLAAAREGGLTKIKVMLDEDLGSNPDEILESALVANIHRQDLDHLDEARALEQLLAVHGTQEALAARLHRSQGWVSQRLALLGLTPELQQKLETGEEPADLLRLVGRKKPEEQEQHLQQLKDKRAKEKADKRARANEQQRSSTEGERTAGLRSGPPSQSGTPDSAGGASETDDDYYDVMDPAVDAADLQGQPTVAVPDPRAEPASKPPQIKMPWADGVASMDIIYSKVLPPERHRLIGRYLELLGGPEAFVADLAAASSPEYRRQVAVLLLKDL